MKMDDLRAAVAAETTVTQSVNTLLSGLKKQLDAAGTNATALNELRSALEKDSKALADAVVENTPADE